jgi:dUTP pyrophosphatase
MTTTAYIKRVDAELPLPSYKTAGAAALDLSSRTTVIFEPKEIKRIPLNVVIRPPEGHWALLVPRSSLHKKGILPANGIGIMDADFCGEDDEYQAALFNTLDEPVTIERGERIMQVLFLPLIKPDIEEVTSMEAPTRGGFGTTGRHA